MSEFKRWYIGVYGGEAQARGCFPHTREIIRESEGVTFALASELEASLAREAALQQRVTAADEALDTADDEFSLMSLDAGRRIAALEGLLREAAQFEVGEHDQVAWQDLLSRISLELTPLAVLKPAEGESNDA